MTVEKCIRPTRDLGQHAASCRSARGALGPTGRRLLLLLGLMAGHVGAAWPEVFVPDVVSQFNSLSVRPDALGFHLDQVPHVKASVDKCRHWQGLWRHQAADGTPYFFVTRSQNRPEFAPDYGTAPDFVLCGFATTGGGNIVIVRFDSRDKTGERLRSNRLVPGHSTQDSSPSILDQAIRSIDLDGTNGWPAYDHPGGMQAVDDVLAVAMEAPLAGASDPPAAVEFIDIRDPEHPVRLSPLVPEPGVQAGVVGFARLPNGRYLLVVTGKTNQLLWFYETRATEADGSTDLRSPAFGWDFLYEWSASVDGQSLGAEWPTVGHQAFTFLREGSPDGPLFLAGARGAYATGDDLMDLYRVELLPGAVSLRHVSTQHKVSYASADGAVLNTGGANQASFAAANAFYVSPSGELLFYSTEHDNDGPFESVKAGEWRHVDMVRGDSPLGDPHALFLGPASVPEGSSIAVSAQGRQPVAQAWMQFWEGTNYTDRYVVMDYADRDRDDFHDFKELDGIVDGFSDEARSWRWFAPSGCTMRANDDDFGDSNFPGEETLTLKGTGQVGFAPNLAEVRSDNGAHSMDEALTSAQFFADCGEYYRAPVSVHWDLDLDGAYELEGYSVVFDAAWLDGPSEAEVPLQAIHSVDRRAGESFAHIEVTNVAPGISRLRALNTLGQELGVDVPFIVVGLEAVIDADFLDQGRLDTHTALIAWGDGSADEQDAFRVFSDATGGVTGRIMHAHRFASAGAYHVELDVADDDLGHDSGSLEVVVVSLDAALGYALQELEALFAATTDAQVLRLLDQARKAIAGNGGALSKLETEQLVAALNELRRAAALLAGTSDAVGATAPLSVIALVAQSIAKQTCAAADPGSSEGAQQQLALALAAIEAGDAALAMLDFAGAIEQYRQSAALIQSLKP